jgi:hypothetical protein
MSLDIVLALFVGVAVGLVLLAVVAGVCYLSGVAYRAPFGLIALVGGSVSTVITLRRLERAAAAGRS